MLLQLATEAPLRVQFLPTFGGRGEEQGASALLSKKGGREGSIESLQKFDISVMMIRLNNIREFDFVFVLGLTSSVVLPGVQQNFYFPNLKACGGEF